MVNDAAGIDIGLRLPGEAIEVEDRGQVQIVHHSHQCWHVRDTPDRRAGIAVAILLAEDNLINQKLATVLLNKAGYQVTVANNGREAVDMYTAHPELFDLIFMDVQMPELSGFDATKEIRQKGFDKTPIIAMTAYAMKGDSQKCIAAGMNDYIAKPIKRELVFEMVHKWVIERPMA